MNDIMTRIAYDDSAEEHARLRVVGVGGGGNNAINRMLAKGIEGVEFVALNTDSQTLAANGAPVKIQLGREITQGLGAGARPEVGAQSAEESARAIEQALEGCDMVFITAGMGGGTGTGAAPVVGAIARKLGILTVGVVTKPFAFEGKPRMAAAERGIAELRNVTDTLLVIPNERLRDIAQSTTLVEAFEMADEVLYNATRGISDLITIHGMINLDFADVRTTMTGGGTALMGSAVASGENRAERAAQEALNSPLLDGISISGATNVLVNLTAGASMTVDEANTAMSIIQREAGADAEVIWGTVITKDSGDDLRVTVIATGFDAGHVAPAAGVAPADAAAPTRVRLTADARTPFAPEDYRGEDNLKQLDQPAYERRPALDADARAAEGEPRAARIVRITAEELTNRHKERISKDDHEVPAFLRRMMD